jgi:hypothetical protein
LILAVAARLVSPGLSLGRAALVLVGAVALPGCSHRAVTTPAALASHNEPRWESLLDPPPEVLLVVRPRALRRDAVYGPLLERAIGLARQHSKVVTAAKTLETIENADEVIVGAPDLSAVDFVVVVRGVPAEVDPARLVDEGGQPLWTSAAAGPVRELARAASRRNGDGDDAGPPVDASLFELPGRTWVITTGKECARARTYLSNPTAPRGDGPNQLGDHLGNLLSNGPDNGLDPQAVAILRLSGPALVHRVRAFRPPGVLAPLGHELANITVVLSSGSDALLRATFSYTSERAVVPAETTLRESLAALSDAKPQTFAWLRASTVQTSRCCVLLATPLPAPLLDVLRAPDAGR